MRHIWKPTLALGVLLAVSGLASAGDRDTQLLAGGSTGSTTMTLGGQGTAAQAATEDTELTGRWGGGWNRGWGGGWGGGWNRGWGGGWGGGWNRGWNTSWGWNRGWGGWGWNRGWGGWGWNTGWGGWGWGGWNGWGWNRAAWGWGWNRGWGWGGWGWSGFSPVVYSPIYYPVYYPSVVVTGISGDVSSGAPAVNLGNSFAPPAPMVQPSAPNDGTFPYDGGPANPVPLPKADRPMVPPANPSATPISGKTQSGIKPATTPYKYKAYGEK